VLGCHCGCWSIQAPKDDRTSSNLSVAHIALLGAAVDDVVDCLQRKVHRHEFNNGLQPHEGSTAANAGKARLGDGRVHNPASSELLEHALGDLVGSVVLSNFLPHQEYPLVPSHLLAHGLVQRLPIREFHLHSRVLMASLGEFDGLNVGKPGNLV
jgi:hypothetical protein